MRKIREVHSATLKTATQRGIVLQSVAQNWFKRLPGGGIIMIPANAIPGSDDPVTLCHQIPRRRLEPL
jgi:hypothetical protein